MRETEDGFRIAEEDLRLRGAGEMLGTQQAGLPLFRIADLAAHGDVLAAARDDAALILGRDAELKSARGEALRTLLYLFERDEAVKLLPRIAFLRAVDRQNHSTSARGPWETSPIDRQFQGIFTVASRTRTCRHHKRDMPP